jgi:hypothetical protein
LNQLLIALYYGHFQPSFYVAAKIVVMDLSQVFVKRKTRGGIDFFYALAAGVTGESSLPQ